MCRRGVLAYIDAVGVHAFPGTWDSEWQGWPELVGGIRDLLEEHGHAPEIWVTETGYSTWRWDEARQVDHFLDAGAAPAERVYWYSYQDIDPSVPSKEGFHFDVRPYAPGHQKRAG